MNVRIRDLREDRDLKQRAVAKMLGVVQSTYSQYEAGTIQMTADKLDLLADFYGTSVDYLMGRTDEKAPYPKSQRPKL